MPNYMIPFVPIIHEDEEPFPMFQDLTHKYGNWILDLLKYDSADGLTSVLEKAVVQPAIKKSDELLLRKAEEIRIRHVNESGRESVRTMQLRTALGHEPSRRRPDCAANLRHYKIA